MKTKQQIEERIKQIDKDLLETYLIAEDDFYNYGITHDVSINVMNTQKNVLEWVLDLDNTK